MNRPILFTTGCPKCKVLKLKLEKANIDFDICEDMNSIAAICDTIGVSYVPILKVEDKYLDFGDAIKWVGEQ